MIIRRLFIALFVITVSLLMLSGSIARVAAEWIPGEPDKKAEHLQIKLEKIQQKYDRKMQKFEAKLQKKLEKITSTNSDLLEED